MKKRIVLLSLSIFGIISISKSQSIPIQVLNSAGGGGSVGTTGVEAYYNIGETVIATNSGSFATATQGFLQPDIVGKFGLTATPYYNGVSCFGKTDGFCAITASISGVIPQSQFNIAYYWEPSSICPTNDCATVNGLTAGTYSCLVVAQYTGTLSVPIDSARVQNIVINDNSSPCLLEIFNGLTPNGDGNNDFFYIGNIDQYPDNVVDIFNRWGQQLAHIKGYDNVNNRWNGTLFGSENYAPTGTYFYIISLGANNSKPIKGWLELLHK